MLQAAMQQDGARSIVRKLMALMLNVVSGKVHQTHVISSDGRNVSQAITYCDMLVNDEIDPPDDGGPGHGSEWCRYIRASLILVKCNLGLDVPCGMIPEDVLNIAYKIHNPAVLPEGYELTQNYPNPFNPRTEISYSLPEACEVRLEIFCRTQRAYVGRRSMNLAMLTARIATMISNVRIVN